MNEFQTIYTYFTSMKGITVFWGGIVGALILYSLHSKTKYKFELGERSLWSQFSGWCNQNVTPDVANLLIKAIAAFLWPLAIPILMLSIIGITAFIVAMTLFYWEVALVKLLLAVDLHHDFMAFAGISFQPNEAISSNRDFHVFFAAQLLGAFLLKLWLQAADLAALVRTQAARSIYSEE